MAQITIADHTTLWFSKRCGVLRGLSRSASDRRPDPIVSGTDKHAKLPLSRTLMAEGNKLFLAKFFGNHSLATSSRVNEILIL
jgi:hypothetical protein